MAMVSKKHPSISEGRSVLLLLNGVSKSYVWGLDFLRLEVRYSYVWGLVFLRLGVSNSYV